MRNIILNAPVESGQFMSLKDCGEASFVNGAMGRGAAVKNTNGRIISPFSGRVLTVYRNAMEIVSNDGIKLFVQIGDLSFYEVSVKENQQISATQILAYFNSNRIVMFTVKNDTEFGDITFQLGGQNYTLKPQDFSTANNSKENDDMAEETQSRRFTILGETGSGKTCYLLGMYYEMSMGEAGWSLPRMKKTTLSLQSVMSGSKTNHADKADSRIPATKCKNITSCWRTITRAL